MPSAQKPWPAVKADLLAELARFPSLGTQVTSFTDTTPELGWKVEHCARELWQNFRDGLKARFGKVRVVKEREGYYVARTDEKRIVGWLDCTDKDKLVLWQAEQSLSWESLQLASTKVDSIGGHGEGFKKGINFALRHGFRVTYKMPYRIWDFALRNVGSRTVRNMVVDVTEGPGIDELRIEVVGPGAAALFDEMMDLELNRDLSIACSSGNYGQLLYSSDPRSYGRVYARGLFVAVDQDLAALGLAANLNIQINRDRHVLPFGFWLLSLQPLLTEVAGSGDPRTTSIFDHLLNRFGFDFAEKGREPRARHRGELAMQVSTFKGAMRTFFARRGNVTNANQVIFLDSAVPDKTESLLRQIGKAPIKDAGALADTVDMNEIITYQVKIAKEGKPETAEAVAAHRALCNLFDAFRMSSLYSRRIELVVKCLPADVAEHHCPMIIGDKVIVDLNFHLGGQQDLQLTAVQIVNDLRYAFCNFKTAMRIVAEFSKDPHAFRARRLEEPTATKVSVDTLLDMAGGEPAKDNGSGNGNVPTTAAIAGPRNGSSQPENFGAVDTGLSLAGLTHPLGRNRHPQKQKHDEEPSWELRNNSLNPLGLDDRICNVDMFSGPRMEFHAGPRHGPTGPISLDSDDEEQVGEGCRFEGRLQAVNGLSAFVNGRTWQVYADTRFDFSAPRNQEVCGRLQMRLFNIVEALDVLRGRIAGCLRISPQLISLVPVMVDRKLLGYTHPRVCHIYINIIPLLDATDTAAMVQSIFFTILHEVTHRVHLNHDTHFADELAKLVYICKDILNDLRSIAL